MWAQYRKTLLHTQLLIVLVSCLAFFYTRRLESVLVQFFIPMQACAVFGAIWGARLKRNLQQRP